MSRLTKYSVSVLALCLGTFVTLFLLYTTPVLARLLPLFATTYPLYDVQPIGTNVTWFDDYYTIEYIDQKTIAIGEPRYHQRNYSYLILGEERAVLFDSGPGVRDIVPVVKSLTSLPVTVTTSHLHYDHTGNMDRFDNVAMIDVPELRAQVQPHGHFFPNDDMHLGVIENILAPTFAVDEWWKPSGTINLGDRKLTVLHTPGHTKGSLMLYDSQRKTLFTGDYIYPGQLFAFVPGSHMGDYLETSERLIGLIDENAVLLPAHANSDLPWQSPRLGYKDLVDLNKTLEQIKVDSIATESLFPSSYRVNEHMELLGNFTWNMEWD